MRSRFQKSLQWIWDHLDPTLALIVALGCSILGLINAVSTTILEAAILATLTIVAFTLIRERTGRDNLEKKLDNIINGSGPQSADTFFSHGSNEGSLLQDAEQEAWIIQETGSRLVETYRNQIISLLERGGYVRIVVCSPEKKTMQFLDLRNANIGREAIMHRSSSFQHQIRDIVTKVKHPAPRLEVRFTPYPMDKTCVIIDPLHFNRSKHKSLVRYAGFKNSYEEKLSFMCNASSSPTTAARVFQEVRNYFEDSSKIVLLTGPPRVGKSALFKKLAEDIEDKWDLFYVFSQEIVDKRERQGFEAIIKGNSQPISFAKRGLDGNYKVIPEALDKIFLLLEAAYKDRKIILFDEIGPLQLQHEALKNLINEIVEDPLVTIFATIKSDDSILPFIRDVKNHYRATLLTISNKRDQEVIEKRLKRELASSLVVAKKLSRP